MTTSEQNFKACKCSYRDEQPHVTSPFRKLTKPDWAIVTLHWEQWNKSLLAYFAFKKVRSKKSFSRYVPWPWKVLWLK